MPFVQAKCPECGGMLAVDDSKKAANCQFCGEAFIVQEAVNNYNTYNTYNTNHNYGEGAVVNVYEDKAKDFIIEAGVLKKYHGASVDVIIPDGVAKIGDSCFRNLDIKSVIIPKSVTSIGHSAFSFCKNLKTITIPESVTSIDEQAFYGCSSITAITIPHSVTTLYPSAFDWCTSLISITVDENNVNYSSADGVLFDKEKTKFLAYPACKADTEYTIPNSVKHIYGIFVRCKNLMSLTIPNDTKEGYLDFYECTKLTSITLPKDMINIDPHISFFGCEALTSVIIPNGTKSISSNAFYCCRSLTSITIPDSVTSVGEYAFAHCTSLISITIPDSVKYVGKCVFYGCEKLCDVNFDPFDRYGKFYSSVSDDVRKQIKEYREAELEKLTEARNATYEERRNKGLCQFCGGEFKGLFSKKCVKCGTPKDY